jgi:hypothetical protein
MLQDARAKAPTYRTGALYHVRAALFWAGAADGRGAVLYGRVYPDGGRGKQAQQVHRLAALWQYMVLEGVGLHSKLTSAQGHQAAEAGQEL